MREFEIRLYRSDGSLSLIVETSGTSDSVAALANVYLGGDFVRAEIWSDRGPVHTVTSLEKMAS